MEEATPGEMGRSSAKAGRKAPRHWPAGDRSDRLGVPRSTIFSHFSSSSPTNKQTKQVYHLLARSLASRLSQELFLYQHASGWLMKSAKPSSSLAFILLVASRALGIMRPRFLYPNSLVSLHSSFSHKSSPAHPSAKTAFPGSASFLAGNPDLCLQRVHSVGLCRPTLHPASL